jgi:hypothetical protein
MGVIIAVYYIAVQFPRPTHGHEIFVEADYIQPMAGPLSISKANSR